VAENVRVSLSRAQLASQAGADLLSLCQAVTSDGSLADEEIKEIQAWLLEHRTTDLPAISFLIPIVEGILQDGVVTEDEKKQLFVAIERVLPAEIRSISKSARRAVETVAKEVQKVEREKEREEKRNEREKRRPIARFDFMVAGTRYQGRGKIIEKSVSEGDSLILERDPRNRHSKNAIEILTSKGEQIGFVPEDDATEIAPLLDAGNRAEATVKKLLTAGRSPLPVVVVSVYSDLASPHKSQSKKSRPSGCMAVIAVFIVTTVICFKSISLLIFA
jgi:hypothetical protein